MPLSSDGWYSTAHLICMDKYYSIPECMKLGAANEHVLYKYGDIRKYHINMVVFIAGLVGVWCLG